MSKISRKTFLKHSALFLGGSFLTFHTNCLQAALARGNKKSVTEFVLPYLPYSFDALAPFIDELTLRTHYEVHHKNYVAALNKALAGSPYLNRDLDTLVRQASRLSEAIRYNAGGHWNHSLYWNLLHPYGRKEPTKATVALLAEQYGSVEVFKTAFSQEALKLAEEGWVWAVIKQNKISITTTLKEDNPLMDTAVVQGNPVMALDMSGHAYEQQYKENKAGYVAAFWQVLNWDYVHQLIDTLKYV